MGTLARVTAVEHLGGRLLRVTFSDGLVREVDFTHALSGVLEVLDNDAHFATATVDAVSGTVCWPSGIDIDPDVLHGDFEAASSVRPRLIREYRLRPTG